MSFEDEHLDVLKNFESMIIRFYRSEPGLNDSNVGDALQALARRYNLEIETGKTDIKPPFMSGIAKRLYAALFPVCEARLGRKVEGVPEDSPLGSLDQIPIETLVACLKRLKTSCDFWTKNGGTRGYLTYVEGFFPLV